MMQQVRILAEGTPVSDLLALVSAKARVDVTAHRDVADDKVTICGPTRPIGDVLTDLAALFNDTWIHTTSADGRDHYILTRNRDAREYENALALDIRNRMMKQLDAYIARAKSPEPYNYEVYRVAAQMLGLLSDEQKQQFLNQKSLTLTFGDLTPSEQLTAKQAVNALYDADEAAAKKSNAQYNRPAATELEQGSLRFRIENSGGNSTEKQQRLFLIIGAAYSEYFGAIDDRIPWLLPSRGNPYTPKHVPTSNAITNLVQIDHIISDAGLHMPFIARLESLSEKCGMPIVADYYRSRPAPLPTVDPFKVDGSKSAGQALDQIGEDQPILWWVRGNTVLLRSRDWYTRRQYETPDRWVLDLQKRIDTQHGIPTYADVIRFTELTQAQMAGLRGSDAPDSATGILGNGADETSLAGLPELLAIYKAQFGSNYRLPVPVDSPNNLDLQRATITYNDIQAENRYLVPAFIRAQPNPASLADSGEAFATRLTRSASQTEKAGTTSLSLVWSKGLYSIIMPKLPVTDRKYKTEVVAVP